MSGDIVAPAVTGSRATASIKPPAGEVIKTGEILGVGQFAWIER